VKFAPVSTVVWFDNVVDSAVYTERLKQPYYGPSSNLKLLADYYKNMLD